MTTLVAPEVDSAFVATPTLPFASGPVTVGNLERVPFDGQTRSRPDTIEAVERVAALGTNGIRFPDDDLVPFGSSSAERDEIICLRRALLSAALEMSIPWAACHRQPIG